MTAPTVSIGLPVYNGGRFIEASLESLLSQTWTDLELIVSDNASTDGTDEICRRYAAADSRVRYLRQSRNVGAARNWNIVVEQARGRYFKWASANDLCAPDLVARTVDALEARPEVVVCYGETELIDDDGASLGVYPHDLTVLDSQPSVRFIRVCQELRLNNAQSGMFRLDVLRRTGIERTFPGGDMGLMSELALYGGFLRLPGVLLYRRMGRQSATKFLSGAELRKFLDPTRADQRQMVAWQTNLDYARSVLRAPIGVREKVHALGYVARSFYWNRARLAAECMARLTRPAAE